jgi:PAS domain S-box-containing protein
MSDMGSLPWPALLLSGDGTLAATSDPAVGLLGFRPASLEALDQRLEVMGPAGAVLGREAVPWRRASHGPFQEQQVWLDRQTRQRLALRVTARRLGEHALLALDAVEDPDAHGRSDPFLRALDGAVRARPPRMRLHELLLNLVTHACELVGARYGALGVVAPDGSLREFLPVGISDEVARRIGRTPEGKGLLGAVIREGRTIRVSEIAADPRSSGFPPHHPPMTAFLGVPLRVAAEVFGVFYVADPTDRAEFGEADAHLLERLAAQAAMTVANARHTEDEAHRLFEALVSNAPHAILFVPADPHQAVFGNPTAQQLLGKLGRATDEASPFRLAHPDGRPVRVDELPSTRALGGETVTNLEVVIRREGITIPALTSAAPVRGQGGAILGAVVAFQDITALKQLERLREDFAAVAAHDLRNPIQAVTLQVDLLLERAVGEDAPVPLATLRNIKLNCQRIQRLINDLGDASLIEARQVRLSLENVPVAEAVSNIIQQMSVTLGDHPVTLDVQGDPSSIRVDPARLDQMLANLLENAAKYSPEGTSIGVTVVARGEGTTIEVADHGPGISAADLGRIFDRYFRAPSSLGARSGLGLGLYIAKGLAEVHGGTLEAESTPGVGSIFRLWMPQTRGARRVS